MADKTGIAWTDATWNPVRGCSRLSPGCMNCYAEKVAARFSGPGKPYEGLVNGHGAWNGQIMTVPHVLDQPLRWRRGRRIFVNSMSDLFHENVPFEFVDRVFAVMALCPEHTFQVLTKRPERMQEYMAQALASMPTVGCCEITRTGDEDDPPLPDFVWNDLEKIAPWPLPNVHLGVSVEDQATADERIPLLLQTPAAVRFVSYEPALAAIDFGRWIHEIPPGGDSRSGHDGGVMSRISWLIVGGESGPGARPMHPDWARSARDQCVDAGVPFFFKQWGAWAPGECVERRRGIVDAAFWFGDEWIFDRQNLAQEDQHRDDEPDLYRIGAKAAGGLLDGKAWQEFPA